MAEPAHTRHFGCIRASTSTAGSSLPMLAGRIILKILKKSKRMLSVSIGGYKDFRFELMNFSQLPDPSIVS
jgi:hypothetical protein